MACMLAATACFAGMNAIIRGLSHALPPPEIAFFRSAFGVLIQLPVLFWFGFGMLQTARLKLHLTRGVVHAVSMIIFFVGLSMTPLATTSSLEFAAPLIATALAVLFVGEVVRLRRIVALAIGFTGVLIVVRPGTAGVHIGELLIILSVVIWAGCLLIIRELSKTESAFVQGFFMVSVFTPVTLIAAIPFWIWPSVDQLIVLFEMSVIATAGTWLYGEAFRRAEMSAILPLESTKLLWATAYGWIFFAETPDPVTILGGLAIFSAAAFITIREAQLARRTPPLSDTPGA